MADVLDLFSEPARAWFQAAFAAPTEVQERGWRAVAGGSHTLMSAPTGSGKTLAAFFWCLDRLAGEPRPVPAERCRVLYVSPLKALTVDVDRNLRAPLRGLALEAARLGLPEPEIATALRTGDTPADERRRMERQPPDVLITTPESLFLILTSAARSILAPVRWVILDEIHSMAGTKRGAHLALSLERLCRLTRTDPVRIGLSATVRPLEEAARFLGGAGREVAIVDAGRRHTGGDKPMEITVEVPVEDMAELERGAEPQGGPAAAIGPGGTAPRRSIWPAIHPRVLELIRAHRSTIVFVNSRRMAERLAARLNELAAEQGTPAAERRAAPDSGLPAPARGGVPELVRAHHGSIAKDERLAMESALKEGRLPALVATSSLELGIDMGAVDLVIQIESPASVASGMQRIGRAGHSVGEPSRGVIFPKHRGDLLESAVVVERMLAGEIEATHVPRNPLDVLAQQIVAMTAMEDWPVEEMLALVRRAHPFADLTRRTFDATLDMLAGRYPSDDFAELRPRVVWDRVEGRVRARAGAQRLAVTSGGTIPDRGLFSVVLFDPAGGPAAGGGGGSAGGDGLARSAFALAGTSAPPGGPRAGRKVGELDEEMVYEMRAGQVFVLGATSWKVVDITHSQVQVLPAPGEPGTIAFWKGDAPGRPVEVGRALGRLVREVGALPPAQALARLRERSRLDARAAENLLAYLADQRAATGVLPDDRTIVVERFRDQIGDWRVCVLSPFGARVHAPWALAARARLEQRQDLEVQAIHTDDGFAVNLPDADHPPDLETLLLDPEEVRELVTAQLRGSALFASRFRENAARSLLLPRRRPGQRTPLWQQRQRSATLLQVAARHPEFPILLETYRECLSDVFDMDGLVDLMAQVRSRQVRTVEVETERASPFASSLMFDYVAEFMYEGDAPIGERRAQALTLDRELLAELLGSEDLRELLDAEVVEALELELQGLPPERWPRDADEAHDQLRRLGDLSPEEAAARGLRADWLEDLGRHRRALTVRIAGEPRWVAAEDAARYRDALGAALPPGLPEAFMAPAPDPLASLLLRYARTHGPFTTAEPAGRWGLRRDPVEAEVGRLVARGELLAGEFRPGHRSRELCHPDVLRSLRRRSLAALRREVEPVPVEALGRFLPAWQGVGGEASGPQRLVEVVRQLQGAALPVSVLERDVLPARVRGYHPALLDQLVSAGEVVWAGRGALGPSDGRVALYLRDEAARLLPAPAASPGPTAARRAGAGPVLDGPPAGAPSEPPVALAGNPAGGPAGDLADRLRERLARGAAFFRDLLAAAPGTGEQEVLDALWDLVWAGEVTNDTFMPLRMLGPRARRGPRRPLMRLTPPGAEGRWSLVADLMAPSPAPTERLHALAGALLQRHGVLTREAALAEGLPGGFSSLYPVLRAMEEAGRIRRGYFVDGLGGSQFALPGAVDRLRAAREPGRSACVCLAATDPANPYGVTVPWPEHPARLARAAGAYVVLEDGLPRLYLERGGRSLLAFGEPGDEALGALAAVAGRSGKLEIHTVDGRPLAGSPLEDAMRRIGFSLTHRGLALYPERRPA
ncbi:MAG TPA: DEAD/DEAH box helicase [Candidatus Dormibacteraeota bacterium]|jgi:ATP-dependent Lhr-like helicase|nr:DEAD/DEAH box helicase [Candidatus Dormibacteraeota bacterium]